MGREAFLAMEVGADLGNHNDQFFDMISNLIVLKYGPEISDLIHFYIYESGPNSAQLKDKDGRVIKLDTSEDLWNLVQKLKSESENIKKDK